jgi:hypothetical protein
MAGEMFLQLDGRGTQRNILRPERCLGQPEIDNLCLPSIGNENVRWFDVTMDDVLCVRRV